MESDRSWVFDGDEFDGIDGKIGIIQYPPSISLSIIVIISHPHFPIHPSRHTALPARMWVTYSRAAIMPGLFLFDRAWESLTIEGSNWICCKDSGPSTLSITIHFFQWNSRNSRVSWYWYFIFLNHTLPIFHEKKPHDRSRTWEYWKRKI